MKNSIVFTLICLFIIGQSNAQDPDLYFRDQQLKKQEDGRVDPTPDSIIHKSGFALKKGDELKVGIGTMPDGSFKYIRINSSSLMQYSGGHQNLSNAANALPPSFWGRNSEILRLQKRGNKKFGYQDYAIIKLGAMARYEVEIDNAIASGEVVIPDEYNNRKDKFIQIYSNGEKISIADELFKLKKLLDDGILTKEEFDAEKKKLLQKQ